MNVPRHSSTTETLRVADAWRHLVSCGADVRALAASHRVLQDSPRSLVCEASTPDGIVVVKRSRRQERSRWIQATGLWRHGEGVRAFDLLQQLSAAGVPVPEPVAAVDVRQGARVLESWVAYRHVEGEACACVDAPAIAELLVRLHAVGWVHRDPHVRNFLRTRDGLVMVDCVSARRRRGGFARAYDFVLLEKCCPSFRAAGVVSPATGSWLRLARLGCRTMVAWRRLKFRIRGSWGRE